MATRQPNAVSGLPYTLVEIDEPKKALGARLKEADTLQWKLWITKYAWFLSMVTMAPGIALIAYVLTGSLGYGLALGLAVTLIPALVFWRRTKGLP